MISCLSGGKIMILGISGSGRKNRIIHQTVKAIVEETGYEYELLSLAGKRINGCVGCTLCAADNICKLEDDWNEIGKKMSEADVIVFGAPNYYGTINALGHACLERTFSFRHQGVFTLQNKIGISVSTSRSMTAHDPVKELIQRFMKSNKMNILGHVTSEGYDQCYTCGFGRDCEVGNVVKDHGILEKIEDRHYPKDFDEQDKTLKLVHKASKLIKDALKF
ncbi:MAG: flavodoxin family protein [Bacillota bacterium]|nr:flavodoxin family protein [Bacillota bacterium]